MDVLLRIMTLAFLVTIVTVCSAESYTFLRCDFITDPRINCSIFSVANHPGYCGSDTKTYANQCTFSQAHCNNTSLYLKHEGNCSNAPSITCQDPYVLVHGHGCVHADNATVHGGQIRDDFFCEELSHRNCPTDRFDVCTSNGMILTNMCEFEKYRCTHKEVTPARMSDCVNLG